MDKALQREKTRERVKRYRNKQKGVTLEGVTAQGVTQYPSLIEALVDKEKRAKIEKISYQLDKFNLSREVRYGVDGPTFDVVAQLLEVTR